MTTVLESVVNVRTLQGMDRENRKIRPFSYFRSGGVRQVSLDTGNQLELLNELDPKEWIVLSLPAKGHEMPDASLAAIDADGNGRIRVREVRDTVNWLKKVLVNMDQLRQGDGQVRLDDIREDTPQGKAVRLSMRLIAEVMEKEDGILSLETLLKGRAILESGPFTGDGILDETVTDDTETRDLISTILATVGGIHNKRGKPGVTRDRLEAFQAACQAYKDWHEKGKDETSMETLFPLGEATEKAAAALEPVESKIEAWFGACEVYAYAPDLVSKQEAAGELEERPLAGIRSLHPLPLEGNLNPAWRDRLHAFREHVVDPLLGDTTTEVTRQQWDQIREQLADYREWRASKHGSEVSTLGIEGVERWLSAEEARQNLGDLIEKDLDLKDDIDGVAMVERLLRLKQDFWEFLENFVNFRRFYDLETAAIFQVGTLYLDGRSFHLCVPVSDPKAHAALASKSGLCLLYCTLNRPGSPVSPTIAVAVTNGNNRRLIAGKHGIFYDREGIEWDATVTQVVEKPINLRQAILEPFRRLGALLVSQVEKLSSSREKALQAQATSSVTSLEGDLAGKAQGTAQPSERPAGGAGGLLAGGGVAIAAITSSLAFLSSTLARINSLYLLYSILVVVLLILLPTAFIAWLRLRSRDIGLLLEASGWAVNAPMRLTTQLGHRLTRLSRYRR
jgi:hypothetical protein